MAELKSSFSWVEWLTTTANIPIVDATRYAEMLANYGVDSVQDLNRLLVLDENFLTSTHILMKPGHAVKAKDSLASSSSSLSANLLPYSIGSTDSSVKMSRDMQTEGKLTAMQFQAQPQSVSSLSSSTDDDNWRNRPCQNELDCRKTIVSILKETRGEAKWNKNVVCCVAGYNWRDSLNLRDWNGDQLGKRVIVDGSGMIGTLLLMSLLMQGELPAIIGNLSSLTQLALCFNALTGLPESIGNLSLSYLNVNYNELRVLPTCLSDMGSLTKLDVQNNPITRTKEGKEEVRRRFGRSSLELIVE